MHTSWVHKKAPEKAGGNSLHISSKNLELKNKKEARSIVNDLITAVEKQETNNSLSYKGGRRGADKRTKYNFVFKMRIICCTVTMVTVQQMLHLTMESINHLYQNGIKIAKL